MAEIDEINVNAVNYGDENIIHLDDRVCTSVNWVTVVTPMTVSMC